MDFLSHESGGFVQQPCRDPAGDDDSDPAFDRVKASDATCNMDAIIKVKYNFMSLMNGIICEYVYCLFKKESNVHRHEKLKISYDVLCV
jgi:hypothetical protein